MTGCLVDANALPKRDPRYCLENLVLPAQFCSIQCHHCGEFVAYPAGTTDGQIIMLMDAHIEGRHGLVERCVAIAIAHGGT